MAIRENSFGPGERACRWACLWLICLALGVNARAADQPDRAKAVVDKLTSATVYIEAELVLSARDWETLQAQNAKKGEMARPRGIASGSGFLISPDGLIVTNAHVVDSFKQVLPLANGGQMLLHFSATNLKVVVHSGQKDEKVLIPRILKLNTEADLALIKISAEPGLHPLAIKGDPLLETGAQVYMAGFPGGKLPDMAPFKAPKKVAEIAEAKNPKVSVNAGMITAVRENNKDVCYQLDIRANHGNSGGPIVNEAGEVVGVLNAGLTDMESINYAIPARYLKLVTPASLGGGESGAAPSDSDASQSYEKFKASGTFKLSK